MESNLYVLLFLIFFSSLMIAVFLWSRHQQRKRSQAIEQLALEMGGQFQETEPAFLEQVKNSTFPLFQRGHSRRLRNLLRRSYQGAAMTVFDYHYVTGSGKHSHHHQQTVILFSLQEDRLPEFVLRPQGFLDDLAAKFGKKDINFEANPEFSRKYHLSGNDEASIRQLFNAGVIDFCDRQPRPVVEANGQQVVCYRQGRLVKVGGWREFMEEAKQMVDYLCMGLRQ